jgi:hypothetical protein
MTCEFCFQEIKKAAEKKLGKAVCSHCGEIWVLVVAENKDGLLKYSPKNEHYWKAVGDTLTDPLGALTEEDLIHLGRS